MIKDSAAFRQTLGGMGISPDAIDAVWPTWWSDHAEGSPSAQAELRFAVARRLGLAPSTLFDETPEFLWAHDAKFKGLTALNDKEKAAIASFGNALSRTLLSMTPSGDLSVLVEKNPVDLRQQILRASEFVTLQSLCALCWGVGIPLVHLRVFPLSAKRMAAMAVRVGDRYSILIGRDASFPAPTAYHLAHELGHIALGHLDDGEAIVDTDEHDANHGNDEIETAADRFALSLLTGSPEPRVEADKPPRNGSELAAAVLKAASQVKIEPGTLSLCYGHETGDWAVANASLRMIYGQKQDVWKVLNSAALRQLSNAEVSDDTDAYVSAVLGAPELA